MVDGKKTTKKYDSSSSLLPSTINHQLSTINLEG